MGARPAPAPPVVLEGRDAELRTLVAALATTRAALVYGVGGIGKTALALAAAASIRPRRRTAYARAVAGYDARQVAAAALEALGSQPGRRPADEMLFALADRAERASAMIVLDDLHELSENDAATVIGTLVRHLGRARVMATSRHRLVLAPELSADVAEVPVRALSPEAAQRLVTVLLGPAADPARALAICAAASGHPLLIKVAVGLERAGVSGDPARALDPARLLPALPAACRDALERMVVAGPMLDAVCEQLGSAEVRAELRRRFLLEGGGGRRGAYSVHDVVRAVVGRTIEPGRRRAAHLAVAQALGPIDPVPAATHAFAAGEHGLGCQLGVQGATDAWLRRAVGEVEGWMAALAQAGIEPPPRVLVAALLCRMGAGDYAGALPEAERLLARAAPGDRAVVLATLVRIRVFLDESHREAALAEFAALEREKIEERDRVHAIDASLHVAKLLSDSGDGKAAVRHIRALRRSAQGRIPQEGLARIESVLAGALLHLGRLNEAVRHCRAAECLYSRDPPRRAAAINLANLGEALLGRGELRRAMRAIESGRARARVLGSAGLEAVFTLLEARLAEAQGRRARARSLGAGAARALTSSPYHWSHAHALLLCARMEVARRRPIRALALVQSARAVARRYGLAAVRIEAALVSAEARQARGPSAAAPRIAARAARDAETACDLRALARARALVARSTGPGATVRRDGAPHVVLVVDGKESRLVEGAAIEAGAAARLFIDTRTGAALVGGRQLRLPEQTWSLLQLLGRAPGRVVSKEQIFHALWGHAYRSTLHDANVHQAVRRLRAALGVEGSSIARARDGYLLRPDGVASIRALESAEGLNERQKWLLDRLARGEPVRNAEYRARFGVFRTTAARDLRELVARGLIRAEGSGRGRRYVGTEPVPPRGDRAAE